MNDQRLKELLCAAPLPAPNGADRDAALQEMLREFRRSDSSVEAAAPWLLYRAAPVFALCVLVCVMFIRFQHEGIDGSERAAIIASGRTTMLETLKVFPRELKAIVLKNDQATVLTEEESPSTRDEAIFIEIRRGTETTRIFTFSGRMVDVDVDAGTMPIEVLVDGSGRIVIAGTNDVWSSNNPGFFAGSQIWAESVRL